ncbi:hypothetical protein [Paraburkholderia caribensis]|uniref:hypothetical protein n=1 Tax=Paraburkholderia caribensis TaxID=75105 RepID=UPI00071F9B8F|nr:hypothetical protein [Paraburkholderia caribensis]ALP65198.1 hypothetical protein AN416_21620 [Paraburkholderia caribensis]AUT53649.1 hypothetical protein C2L66_16870 [Paraburkholderia caribensis]
MATYCITAAKHENRNNHVASSFEVFVAGDSPGDMVSARGMSAKDIVELLENGHTVITGKIENGEIYFGAPVEIELRIAKNETLYPISEMPTF